jgi:hypothetical protein
MIVAICGMGLSVALGSSTVAQVTSTRIDMGRADALNAALSGLQVVAAHVRAAVDSEGAGRVGLLPCEEKAGLVDSRPAGAVAAPRPSYRVTIQYYQFDPVRTAGNPVLTCYPGSGTSKLPSYAVLTSRGEDGRPNGVTRTLTATYLLRNTNQNIAGGLIRVWRMPGAPYDLCLDAGPVMPTGSNVVELRVQQCDRDSPQQLFAYHANLNLVYVPSKSDANPLGMCLDAGANPVDRTPVRFRPCAGTTIRQQQWSYNDNRNFVGTNASADFNDLCFNLEDGVVQPNTRIILRHLSAGGCYVGPDNNTQMFAAEATVGAGAAENSPNQLVNFTEFGRCLDVTQYEVAATYLISYPCKQAPRPDKVTWNQRFTIPTLTTNGDVTSGTGRIFTELVTGDYEKSDTGVTGKFCLTTEAVTITSPYVTISRCPATAGTPLQMQWRVVRRSVDYTSSYRIETTVFGRLVCLAASSRAADKAPDDMSKIVVEPCSDSLNAKWNAPAHVREPSPFIRVAEK